MLKKNKRAQEIFFRLCIRGYNVTSYLALLFYHINKIISLILQYSIRLQESYKKIKNVSKENCLLKIFVHLKPDFIKYFGCNADLNINNS